MLDSLQIYGKVHNSYSTHSHVHSILLFKLFIEENTCPAEVSFFKRRGFFKPSVSCRVVEKATLSQEILQTLWMADDLVRWSVMKWHVINNLFFFLSSVAHPTLIYSIYFCIIRREQVRFIIHLTLYDSISSVVKSPSLLVVTENSFSIIMKNAFHSSLYI